MVIANYRLVAKSICEEVCESKVLKEWRSNRIDAIVEFQKFDKGDYRCVVLQVRYDDDDENSYDWEDVIV